MERIRVGVIGVGWFGTVHCRVIAGHPELELAALCDASEERLAEMAREHGVARTCTDYGELVDDPTIDALAVITPWDHHAEPTLAGLAAGKLASLSLRVVAIDLSSHRCEMTIETLISLADEPSVEPSLAHHCFVARNEENGLAFGVEGKGDPVGDRLNCQTGRPWCCP